MKKIWIISVACLMMLLTACSNSGVDGVYENKESRLTFDSKKGTVLAEGIGRYKYTNEMPFTQNGNKIILHTGAKGDQVIAINENGDLVISGEDPFIKIQK